MCFVMLKIFLKIIPEIRADIGRGRRCRVGSSVWRTLPRVSCSSTVHGGSGTKQPPVSGRDLTLRRSSLSSLTQACARSRS